MYIYFRYLHVLVLSSNCELAEIVHEWMDLCKYESKTSFTITTEYYHSTLNVLEMTRVMIDDNESAPIY